MGLKRRNPNPVVSCKNTLLKSTERNEDKPFQVTPEIEAEKLKKAETLNQQRQKQARLLRVLQSVEKTEQTEVPAVPPRRPPNSVEHASRDPHSYPHH
eukprot:Pgem_evm1s14384